MITGIKSAVWILLATLLIIGFLFWSSYRKIAQVFKWTTLVLTAYIGAAFFAHVDWRAVALATVYPRIAWTREYFAVLVAILGTTISPYLFFWQAAQEVEEVQAKSRQTGRRQWATVHNLQLLGTDVGVGMFTSNLIMYFVILTTAATLHTHGVTQIQTARQAAEALRPVAGSAASLLFAFGLFGTGMLGVPVLAGSSAYALTEAAAWRGSLEKKPADARGFYTILAASLAIGLILNYAGIPAMKMMFWSAVINGALAPPLILLIILLTNDAGVMGNRINSTLLKLGGWSTFGLMSLATAGMLITMGS